MTFWYTKLIVFLFSLGEINGRCPGGLCDKFSCVSDFYVHRPVDNHLRSGSTFNSPCSCSNDWNAMFCNETNNIGLIGNYPLPTVCICRKFSDQGSKCQQFITRCFPRKNDECSCCFNQPKEWCNQLKCKNREPDFSSANTTCVCHHNSADYPYEICNNLYPRDYSFGTRETILTKHQENAIQAGTEYVELLGRRVPASTITCIIVSLLIIVSFLTLIMLLIGGQKFRRRRNESQRQRRLVRETLIMQRADDDRYLPTA